MYQIQQTRDQEPAGVTISFYPLHGTESGSCKLYKISAGSHPKCQLGSLGQKMCNLINSYDSVKGKFANSGKYSHARKYGQ